jgi:hypothetical protein
VLVTDTSGLSDVQVSLTAMFDFIHSGELDAQGDEPMTAEVICIYSADNIVFHCL